jgi:hypothetical protein
MALGTFRSEMGLVAGPVPYTTHVWHFLVEDYLF